MIISKENIELYLFERGLLAELRQSKKKIKDYKNNRNYGLNFENKFYIKNLRYTDEENISLFNKEAKFYNYLKNENIELDFIPKLFLYDSKYKIYIYEFIKNKSLVNKELNNSIIKNIRAKIKLYQNLKIKNGTLENFTPWIFNFSTSQKQLISKKNNFISEINFEQIEEKILYLKKKYNYDCICHGDFKLDNVLYSITNRNCYIIDWELFGIGDSCWDASYFTASSILQHIFKSNFKILGNKMEILYFEYITELNQFMKLVSHLFIYKNNKLKFIEFTGLALLQQVLELSIKNSINEKGRILLLIAQKMIITPNEFNRFL